MKFFQIFLLLDLHYQNPEFPWAPKTAKEGGEIAKEMIFDNKPSSKRTQE